MTMSCNAFKPVVTKSIEGYHLITWCNLAPYEGREVDPVGILIYLLPWIVSTDSVPPIREFATIKKGSSQFGRNKR